MRAFWRRTTEFFSAEDGATAIEFAVPLVMGTLVWISSFGQPPADPRCNRIRRIHEVY
jgi:Flp pilus assembly pilin Flp